MRDRRLVFDDSLPATNCSLFRHFLVEPLCKPAKAIGHCITSQKHKRLKGENFWCTTEGHQQFS